MRTFRGQPVIGWKVITCSDLDSRTEFEKQLNDLMDKYEFVDCQYSLAVTNFAATYSAIILIAKKPKKATRSNNKVKQPLKK